MFKPAFFLGITSGLLVTGACLIYSGEFYKVIADFSEAAGWMKILSMCMMFSMGSCFLYIALNKMIRKAGIAEFVFNMIISMASIAAVFYVLKIDDPVFKNEDAMVMSCSYKGFVMPMLFFPALAWYTFKPLFIKK